MVLLYFSGFCRVIFHSLIPDCVVSCVRISVVQSAFPFSYTSIVVNRLLSLAIRLCAPAICTDNIMIIKKKTALINTGLVGIGIKIFYKISNILLSL
ncbi:Uncharacterised protein [uncultured archaeon]|nr:Uncharacterised protein [uncultured archaeon]